MRPGGKPSHARPAIDFLTRHKSGRAGGWPARDHYPTRDESGPRRRV